MYHAHRFARAIVAYNESERCIELNSLASCIVEGPHTARDFSHIQHSREH